MVSYIRSCGPRHSLEKKSLKGVNLVVACSELFIAKIAVASFLCHELGLSLTSFKKNYHHIFIEFFHLAITRRSVRNGLVLRNTEYTIYGLHNM